MTYQSYLPIEINARPTSRGVKFTIGDQQFSLNMRDVETLRRLCMEHLALAKGYEIRSTPIDKVQPGDKIWEFEATVKSCLQEDDTHYCLELEDEMGERLELVTPDDYEFLVAVRIK